MTTEKEEGKEAVHKKMEIQSGIRSKHSASVSS